jgi:N-acetylglucosamine-6-phosphate deacetylase
MKNVPQPFYAVIKAQFFILMKKAVRFYRSLRMKRIKSDKIILSDRLFDGYIYFEGGKIKEVTELDYPVSEDFDMTGNFVSPGFIDIHTHGGGGFRFGDSVDDVIKGCNFHLQFGTTSICPTLSAAPFEKMAKSTLNVEKAMSDPRAKGTILGAHLEGPYLSKNQTGAQCPDHITPPIEEDYLPLLKEHSKAIARWSYAPENDLDEKFAKALKEYGVVAAAGHTDAIYGDMIRAQEQGCNLVTHLYSCTSTITRDHGFRRLGVIETAYL